jgi:hypothetical protein
MMPESVIEFHYPGGEQRGARHVLQRWEGTRWVSRYQVFASDPEASEPADVERITDAWAYATEEAFVPSIAYSGTAPHQSAIPPPAEGGSYRLCGESTMHCSLTFRVDDR